MKIIIILMAIAISTFLPAQTVSSDSTGSIIVNIKNIKNNDGQVLVGLYNTEKTFKKFDSFKAFTIKIIDNKASCVFEKIPFGIYAIAIIHDEDSNSKLNTGLFGIPSEDYGFSNNAKGTFGPAKFEDAKFKLNKKELVQDIKF